MRGMKPGPKSFPWKRSRSSSEGALHANGFEPDNIPLSYHVRERLEDRRGLHHLAMQYMFMELYIRDGGGWSGFFLGSHESPLSAWPFTLNYHLGYR